MKIGRLLAVCILLFSGIAGCSGSAPFDVHVVSNEFGGTSKMVEFWAKSDGILVNKIVANDGSCNADPHLGYPVKLTAQQPRRTGTGCTIISELTIETNQGTFEFSF